MKIDWTITFLASLLVCDSGTHSGIYLVPRRIVVYLCGISGRRRYSIREKRFHGLDRIFTTGTDLSVLEDEVRYLPCLGTTLNPIRNFKKISCCPPLSWNESPVSWSDRKLSVDSAESLQEL